MPERCERKFTGYDLGKRRQVTTQCNQPAVVCREGKWYCDKHDPENFADYKVKQDAAKDVRPELVDPFAYEGLARALAKGAASGRYDEEGWRNGVGWKRIIGSIERHLIALKKGEDIDEQTELPHVDCLAAQVMFLSASQKRGYGTDDRVKGGDDA